MVWFTGGTGDGATAVGWFLLQAHRVLMYPSGTCPLSVIADGFDGTVYAYCDLQTLRYRISGRWASYTLL